MWTGDRVLPWALLTAALLSAGCAFPADQVEEAPVAAWWYAIEFDPVSADINGVPVDKVNPAWTRASTLTAEALGLHVSEEGLVQYETSGLAFELRADLDKDGTNEEVFVGVFETGTGAVGRFLAVTENGVLVQHFEHPGSAGFSALVARPDEVRWYKCMECGEYESLSWSGRSYVLE